MPRQIEIRPLERGEDWSGFHCGQAHLDRFFHHYAGQNQFRLRIAVTWVACVESRIAGYATVVSGSLERRKLPGRTLRRRMPVYPLPVLRLARLAVDERVHGIGIGAALLRHVMGLALEQRDRSGCAGVVADAKPDAVAFYQGYGFEPLHGVLEGLLHGEPTPMFLAIGTIETALAP